MTQSNDNIKLPVRAMTDTCCLIVDNEGSLLGSVNNSHHRAEFIHALNMINDYTNGYGVAVDALRHIYNDREDTSITHGYFAERTLKELGELDNDRTDSGPVRAFDECDDLGDDGVDTCCWRGGCDRPIGTDPMYCPFHEKMVNNTQEVDDAK